MIGSSFLIVCIFLRVSLRKNDIKRKNAVYIHACSKLHYAFSGFIASSFMVTEENLLFSLIHPLSIECFHCS